MTITKNTKTAAKMAEFDIRRGNFVEEKLVELLKFLEKQTQNPMHQILEELDLQRGVENTCFFLGEKMLTDLK